MPITKKTTLSQMIDDFVSSDDPKFAGDSKEQRRKRAVGAWYGMHTEGLFDPKPSYATLKYMKGDVNMHNAAVDKKQMNSVHIMTAAPKGYEFGSDKRLYKHNRVNEILDSPSPMQMSKRTEAEYVKRLANRAHNASPEVSGIQNRGGYENDKWPVTDKKTGERYDPKEKFKELLNHPDTKAQFARMKAEKGKGWPKSAAHESITPFSNWLNESRGTISGSGMDMKRHKEQYIDPYIGSKSETHVMSKSHNDIPKGAGLKIHKTELKNNILHAHVTDNITNKKSIVPVSKLEKPGEVKKNKGLEYEKHFVQRLNNHGLMKGSGAGSTAGTDYHLIDKRKNVKHKGLVKASDTSSIHLGETKDSPDKAAFGQATIHYHHQKGWHIPDSTRNNRPKYCHEIEKVKIKGDDGYKRSVLSHMNKFHKPDKLKIGGEKAKNVTVEHPNSDPAHAYLKDHHVDVIQIQHHGTYHVGEEDKTKHGLPKLEGSGKWTIRQKTSNPNHRTVMFQFKKSSVKKSHVDLDRDDDVKAIKKTLGH